MAEDTKKPAEETAPESAETPANQPAEAPEAAAEAPADTAEAPAEPVTETDAAPAAEAEEPAEAEPEAEPEEEPLEHAYKWIKPGMIVKVHLKIKEMTPKGDERERIQVFEGTVIAKKGRSAETATITVRKVSGGIGVERIFPLMMPTIDKIELVKELRVRRSKIYFVRQRRKKKLKEVGAKKQR
jgi:large subunit ribosomal protein L19